MGHRRPVDFVGWRLYRRALVVPVVALLVVLSTSFRAEVPVQAALPPTLANEQAATLLTGSREFEALFPDRRPGSPGAIDSAQWMLDEFQQIGGLRGRTVPATTIDPATGRSIGLVNVEAVLPGRTRELVVLHAHRDTADRARRGSDAVGQLALLSIARELAATRDRRRTYLFVSTDGATLNGGGARALGERLARRGGVVAIIGIDRLGAGGTLRVDASASGTHAAPLGLVQAARGSVAAEGGDGEATGLLAQLSNLAAPVTLREHGQLLTLGLPALTVTAGDDQLHDDGDDPAEAAAVGSGLRAVQRLVGTIEQVDQLQSAGKTWIANDQRVYRGWALKILMAALLIPVWLAAVDMLVRHRRGWNLAASVGTCARALLAGIVAVAALWALGVVGLLPASVDRPPNPGSLEDVRVFGMIVWLLVATAAWLVARGPDWRRQRRRSRSVAGPDTPEVVVALLALVVLAVLALAINPYTVLFAAPALHAWMCVASWRVIFSRTRVLATWAAGLVGPALAVIVIGARSDTGLGAAWFSLQLLQTRTIPPLLALLVGAGAAAAGLLLVAALGRVAFPALPNLRARFLAVHDGEVTMRDLVPVRALRLLQAIGRGALGLRLPRSRRTAQRRATPPPRAPRGPAAPLTREARALERERLRSRSAERRADRPRVKSR